MQLATSQRLATARIVSDDTEAGYVIINRADFDPKTHKVHPSDPGVEEYVEGSVASVDPGIKAAPDFTPTLIHRTQPLATVAIVDDDVVGGFRRINAEDFDGRVHTRYVAPPKADDDRDEDDAAPPAAGAKLADMTRKQLRDLAAKLGVTAPTDSKTDVLAALTAHFDARTTAPTGDPNLDPAAIAAAK